MTNLDLSLKVFDFLIISKVQTVVVCAGARNAALVMALEKTNFKIIQFFEERSAAFFAIGLMKSSQVPVAVLTTSGTAVAELLPAAVEATYQALPLILITADRPKNYRGSGAPQSIQQTNIFSDYVEEVYDLDVYTESFKFNWSFRKPIQINVCFDEPLLDQASGQETQAVSVQRMNDPRFANDILKIHNPLVILGELDQTEALQVKNFLRNSNVVIYAEALSQLASDTDLLPQMIRSSEVLVKKAFEEKIFDSVIRIGGVPTLRFWRDLENQFANISVFNFTNRPFSGLARDSKLFALAQLHEVQIESSDEVLRVIQGNDQTLQNQKLELIKKFPFSEPACVFHFSKLVDTAALYLGNSLPIRHWDSFSDNASVALYGNRGANGIDGQISTYLGWSEGYQNSYCFTGDLTALYDLAALGLTTQLQKNRRRIVIMNNFGGQIFQRVLKNKIFINEHQIQFQNWALMWGWDYQIVKSVSDFQKLSESQAINSIIEIQPDVNQTKLLWDQWDRLCQRI